MTRAVIFGMLGAAAVAAAIASWPAPEGPEPIAWGRDACAHCRMHLSRPGFGGELRDGHGTLSKYDDIGCLLHVLRTRHRETPGAWVEDRAGGGFLPLTSAHLVRVDGAETPMGSGVVAFASREAARAFAGTRRGEVVPIERLLREPAGILDERESIPRRPE